MWINDSTLLQHFFLVDTLQATRPLWRVPPTRTWRTVWPSSSPPWSLSLSERPVLEQPPASTPSWRTAALLPPAGLVETCVMPTSRTAQAPSAYMDASQSEITCQPRVSGVNTHIHVSSNMRSYQCFFSHVSWHLYVCHMQLDVQSSALIEILSYTFLILAELLDSFLWVECSTCYFIEVLTLDRSLIWTHYTSLSSWTPSAASIDLFLTLSLKFPYWSSADISATIIEWLRG